MYLCLLNINITFSATGQPATVQKEEFLKADNLIYNDNYIEEEDMYISNYLVEEAICSDMLQRPIIRLMTEGVNETVMVTRPDPLSRNKSNVAGAMNNP